MDQVKILDHGYLKFIESWGSDQAIIESARMSTDKGFLGWGKRHQCEYCGLSVDEMTNTPAWMSCSGDGASTDITTGRVPHHMGPYGPPGDEKLLRYLYEHKHSTPFEFAGLTIEIQAPLMVFREWHRHRTQSYSEMSARYTPLPDVNYMPTEERCFYVGGTNKQAGSVKGTALTHEKALLWLEHLQECYYECEAVYQEGLAFGIPKEVARLSVPVGRYSRMRATANLRNWLGFLTLRMDATAQWEIRQFAQAVGNIIAVKFPRTWELFKS